MTTTNVQLRVVIDQVNGLSVTVDHIRGTAAGFAASNPVLGFGVFGYETDTERGKFGDGTTAYNSLTYFAGTATWASISGKPSFATIATTGLYSDLSGVPATFPPSSHNHIIADTTGLQTALDAKAPLASPTFTGTVTGVTKAMVGLGSADNVADASKPVSTLQAAADSAVQAYAIQRANHTGTQGVGTITGLGSLATQSGTFSGTSSGTNTGDQTASTVSVAGGYGAFTPSPMTVEGALSSISGALDNKADSSPATTTTLGPMIVGTGLAVASGTVSVSYGTSSSTACVGNDARLSDARTPTSHTHGNITSSGAIGSTADKVAVTTTGGVVTTATIGSGLSLSGGTLSATGGGGAGITDGNKGDITVSGSGTVWTINSSSVTDADIVEMSASKLTGTINNARLSDEVAMTTDLYLWSSFR